MEMADGLLNVENDLARFQWIKSHPRRSNNRSIHPRMPTATGTWRMPPPPPRNAGGCTCAWCYYSTCWYLAHGPARYEFTFDEKEPAEVPRADGIWAVLQLHAGFRSLDKKKYISVLKRQWGSCPSRQFHPISLVFVGWFATPSIVFLIAQALSWSEFVLIAWWEYTIHNSSHLDL